MRVDEHTIYLDESPVFYRSASPPDVPPLYLHGVPTSSEDWTALLDRVGGIAPDLIGFGRSAKGGHLDYSLDGIANFVERLLDELGVDRIKLVGHCWGAAGGLVFAQRHPARVERVVLCNALPLLHGFHWPRPARLWRLPGVGELLMGSTNRWLLARFLRRGSVDAAAWPDSRVASVWEQFDQGTQRAILRLHRSADEQALASAGARLSAIQSPALVIWGEQDPWLSAELGAAYAAKFLHGTFEPVPLAGHWPWLDQAGVVDRVAAFLETSSPGT